MNAPGCVLYKQRAGLGYHMVARARFACAAHEGRTSVRYADGKVEMRHERLFSRRDPKPGPQSEVFVPARDSTDKTNYVAMVGAVAQILASTVAIIVVLRR